MHVPVLLNELISLLNPQPGEMFIDGTFGAGGHSRMIVDRIKPQGRLLALDWNRAAITKCQLEASRLKAAVIDCAEGNFADLPEIMAEKKFPKADGLLLDLGISFEELENSGRGFSFQKNEPLLMTYSDGQRPAREILSQINEIELVDIIRKFGEERFAGRIARSIKENQRRHPISTTLDLVRAVKAAVPKKYERGRIHPATRTFQALRIYTNDELGNLAKVLDSLGRIIKPGGRAAVISFHSLEDRLVKNKLRDLAKAGTISLLNKKPIRPSEEEIKSNPRSRSAKLRALKMN